MGILINLGKSGPSARSSSNVRAGREIEIRTGTSDPGDSASGDKALLHRTPGSATATTEKTDGTNEVFTVFDPEKKYQYVLVFITELPRGDDGRYQVNVNNIEVYGN